MKELKDPGIGIRISRATRLEGDREVAEPYEDIEISGNRQGLIKLAEVIRRIAEAPEPTHTHIYPDDEPALLRTKEYSLTIEKNSAR